MSNSRRKSLIHGNTHASSDKKDKQIANRTLRRKIRTKDLEDEDINHMSIRDVSNVYNFEKDGKHYYRNFSELSIEEQRKYLSK